MNEKEEARMKKDINQLIKPIQSTIITKHYCYSFISFLIANMKENIIELIKNEEKFNEVREELQLLRLNRGLNHCKNPECEQFDYCFGECDLE